MIEPLLSVRIDMRPHGQVGPGKIALLKKVQETRSISAAARSLKMSYRRAWLLIDQMNKTFAQNVVETSIGGRDHGGARLTSVGIRIVACYEAIVSKAAGAAQSELAELAAHVAPKASSAAPAQQTPRS